MGFFNDSLTPLMGKKSSASVYGTSETDNAMDCPECCSLITPSNNRYYLTMMVPKEFKEKVLVHVVSQYMTLNKLFVPPLYLAIEGPAGEGKTSQTIAVLTQYNIEVLYVSASEISGSHEGDSVKILNDVYNYAVQRSKRGYCIAILIDDFHMGTINQDSRTEKLLILTF